MAAGGVTKFAFQDGGKFCKGRRYASRKEKESSEGDEGGTCSTVPDSPGEIRSNSVGMSLGSEVTAKGDEGEEKIRPHFDVAESASVQESAPQDVQSNVFRDEEVASIGISSSEETSRNKETETHGASKLRFGGVPPTVQVHVREEKVGGGNELSTLPQAVSPHVLKRDSLRRQSNPLHSSAPSFPSSRSSPRFSSSPRSPQVSQGRRASSAFRSQCTTPEPFNLYSLARHNDSVERRQRELEAKTKEEDEKRKFKARPIKTVRNYQPPRRSLPPSIMRSAGFKIDDIELGGKKVDPTLEEKRREKDEAIRKQKEELAKELLEFEESCRFKSRPLPRFYKKAQEPITAAQGTLPPQKVDTLEVGQVS